MSQVRFLHDIPKEIFTLLFFERLRTVRSVYYCNWTFFRYMSTKKVPVSEYKLLLRIHQALVTFGQNSLQIPEKYLQKARTFARERAPSKSDLKVRLHQILDSPDHLVSSVVTSNDIYIGKFREGVILVCNICSCWIKALG